MTDETEETPELDISVSETEETPELDLSVSETEVLKEMLQGLEQELRFLKQQLAAMAVQNRKLLAAIPQNETVDEEAGEPVEAD